MDAQDDVRLWMERLAEGDSQAAEALWHEYYGKLVRFARTRLEQRLRRSVDEEDVALSAIKSFCRGVSEGRFPRLDDHDDLWKLLITIVVRKVRAQRRMQLAQKRGGGRVVGESAIFAQRDQEEEHLGGVAELLGVEPTPELAASMAESCDRLLDALGDETLKRIAIYRLEGFHSDEIAEKLGCVRETVQRKLRIIRRLWSREDFQP